MNTGNTGYDNYGFWSIVTVKGIDIRFRWIKSGKFLMGSPEEEPERQDDELQHEVTLTKGFWMAETACTQELWEAVMKDNPSHFKGPQRPVEQVSWVDVMDFIEHLNSLREDLNLRLPTEAEWEYACRAGTTGPFSFGEIITVDQVNYNGYFPCNGGPKGIYREETVDVESLLCNQWGLHQMHGNVWEWCADWYGRYELGETTDPIGPENGKYRVIRGGSWFDSDEHCRSAFRWYNGPGRFSGSGFYGRTLGFRLARERNK
jgi:formylglycine-generating enzyme required for sulfatase activity